MEEFFYNTIRALARTLSVSCFIQVIFSQFKYYLLKGCDIFFKSCSDESVGTSLREIKNGSVEYFRYM